MAISVVLPQVLAPYAQGHATVLVDASCPTVDAALACVRAQWPAVTDRILTEQGALRRHVNLFVDTENVRFLHGLATPVRDGSTIMVVAAVSGG